MSADMTMPKWRMARTARGLHEPSAFGGCKERRRKRTPRYRRNQRKRYRPRRRRRHGATHRSRRLVGRRDKEIMPVGMSRQYIITDGTAHDDRATAAADAAAISELERGSMISRLVAVFLYRQNAPACLMRRATSIILRRLSDFITLPLTNIECSSARKAIAWSIGHPHRKRRAIKKKDGMSAIVGTTPIA